MLKLIFNRLVTAVPLLIGVSVLVFLFVPLIPGDPAVTLAGENASAQQIADTQERLGLDEPIVERYLAWFGDAVTGDLGESLFTRRDVTSEIFTRLPVTGSLILLALLFGSLTGLAAGVVAGVNRNRWPDRAAVTAASLGVALPNFWLGLLFVYFFAINRSWFPATGYTAFADSPLEWLRHLMLPAIALGTATAAELTRQVRGALIDSSDEDYIRAAYARGLRRPKVIGKHALKNAGVTISTVVGIQVSVLIGASVVVEQVFGLPGLGSLAVNSVLNRDLPVMQGLVLVTAVIIILTNLIIDLAYGWFNPRMRSL